MAVMKMAINLSEYATVDFAKTHIPDCLVKSNKIGAGSGEAKLYVGGVTIKDWDSFFESFSAKCFFTKADLRLYLELAEFEYKNPSQGYKNPISGSWEKYIRELNSFDDIIFFDVFHKEYKNKSRYYIKSNDLIYDYFRRISLPNITTLLIQKISADGNIYLWFRPYLNDFGNELDQQLIAEEEEQISKDIRLGRTEKEQIIKARIGQGAYRDKIIAKYSRCVISNIDDTRILIASHIKPWISSNNDERVSRHNGLLLAPTYDKLFDKGFISFRDSGQIILSNHFSDDNFKKIGLCTGDKFKIGYSAEMKSFLEYHRDVVFMK